MDPAARRRRRRTLRSFWWRHRPLALGVLTFLAVLSLLPLLRPQPEGSPLVVAAADLPAGTELTAGDVVVVRVPEALLPPDGLTTLAEAVGLRLAHPVGEGVAVLAPSSAGEGWGLEAGEVAVPVRLADPLVATLLSDGDVLRLVRADGETTAELTASARLLAQVTDAVDGGLLAGTSPTSPLLVVAVPEQIATLVLDASADGTLVVALQPHLSHPAEPPVSGGG